MIRLARPNDAQKMARLSRDLIETGLGWSWTPKRVLGSLQRQDTCSIVAEGEDPVAGFAIMEFLDQHAHLSLLAIDQPHQRRGIGRSLVEWLEKSARTAGIGIVYVEARVSNQAARDFYRRLGYREMFLVPGYYRGREAAIRLGHDLRSTVPSSA
jgi:ribosomal-protein-alanine N-acetyltransferase